MKTYWISLENMGEGFSHHVTASDIEYTSVINGFIKFENLRTGGMRKEQFEEALNEFLATISID
ncbi:MAG: hypothetical protein PQJ61_12280 [Spirochaetales bacterium]|uniref:Uncharacterized protein n=1 Tax=Candidatus Thalassospirochaeta sargassi TaxID=3119039 RepID=A0AAJ1IDX4_9SPIO|nr:hypothetical protein [Spirochaetales bacterium]